MGRTLPCSKIGRAYTAECAVQDGWTSTVRCQMANEVVGANNSFGDGCSKNDGSSKHRAGGDGGGDDGDGGSGGGGDGGDGGDGGGGGVVVWFRVK